MIETVVIDYETAVILAKAHNEICVQDSHSGAFFSFTDPDWEHRGVMKSYKSITETYDMDSEFNFIWVKNVVTE